MMMQEEYNSEEDEDYQPLNKEQKQFEMDQQYQVSKKNKGVKVKVNVEQAWRQLKQDSKLKQKQEEPKLTREQIIQLSAKVLSNSEIKREKKVIFAGKQFILDENTGEMREITKQALSKTEQQKQPDDSHDNQRALLSKQYGYLNHVIYSLQQRYRNINSIHKSKMDWKNFVKKEGIEEKLNFNRKGGALEDVKFIKRTEQKR